MEKKIVRHLENTVDFLQMPKAASLFFYSSDGVYSSK